MQYWFQRACTSLHYQQHIYVFPLRWGIKGILWASVLCCTVHMSRFFDFANVVTHYSFNWYFLNTNGLDVITCFISHLVSSAVKFLFYNLLLECFVFYFLVCRNSLCKFWLWMANVFSYFMACLFILFMTCFDESSYLNVIKFTILFLYGKFFYVLFKKSSPLSQSYKD